MRMLLGLFNGLPNLNMEAAHKFADLVSKRDADNAWRTATEIASRSLCDLVSAGARNMDLASRGYTPEEAQSLMRLTTLADTSSWIEVWEKNNELFARADSANLDRKQVMISALTAMENTTRTGV